MLSLLLYVSPWPCMVINTAVPVGRDSSLPPSPQNKSSEGGFNREAGPPSPPHSAPMDVSERVLPPVHSAAFWDSPRLSAALHHAVHGAVCKSHHLAPQWERLRTLLHSYGR